MAFHYSVILKRCAMRTYSDSMEFTMRVCNIRVTHTHCFAHIALSQAAYIRRYAQD